MTLGDNDIAGVSKQTVTVSVTNVMRAVVDVCEAVVAPFAYVIRFPPAFAPNVQASGFVSNQPSQYRNAEDNARPFAPPTNLQPLARPFVPPPNPQRNDAAKTLDSADAPVCYFHQTFGDKARTCRSPCAFSLNC